MRKLLLAGIGGAAVSSLFAISAVAAPENLGVPHTSPGLITLAHHAGGHISMHTAGPGPRLYPGAMFHEHFHDHHHHRHFFVAGVPYYDYYYDDSCWWSRRYHRWICPSY